MPARSNISPSETLLLNVLTNMCTSACRYIAFALKPKPWPATEILPELVVATGPPCHVRPMRVKWKLAPRQPPSTTLNQGGTNQRRLVVWRVFVFFNLDHIQIIAGEDLQPGESNSCPDGHIARQAAPWMILGEEQGGNSFFFISVSNQIVCPTTWS